MKSVFSSLGAAFLVAGSLSSCAVKLTEAQRRALPAVAVARTEVAADAYQRPDAGSEEARQVSNQAVGGMLGVLIGEGIHAAQNSSFHHSHGNDVATIAANAPRDLGRQLDDELARSLKKDSFFGPRLRPQAAAVWQPKLVRYGLVRLGKRNDEVLFRASVTVDIELKDSSGKKVTGGFNSGFSKSTHTSGEFAGNPKLLRDACTEALRSAMEGFDKELAKRTAP